MHVSCESKCVRVAVAGMGWGGERLELLNKSVPMAHLPSVLLDCLLNPPMLAGNLFCYHPPYLGVVWKDADPGRRGFGEEHL